jgi:hypothetical protein
MLKSFHTLCWKGSDITFLFPASMCNTSFCLLCLHSLLWRRKQYIPMKQQYYQIMQCHNPEHSTLYSYHHKTHIFHKHINFITVEELDSWELASQGGRTVLRGVTEWVSNRVAVPETQIVILWENYTNRIKANVLGILVLSSKYQSIIQCQYSHYH